MDIITLLIMAVPIGLFLALSYLIVVRKNYDLISGYATRSKDEQDKLVRNGYPQAIGRVLFISMFAFIIGIPLQFLDIPYAMELTFGIFFLVVMIGTLWATKFEIKEKRKKSFIIQGVIFVVVVGFISYLFFTGYQKNELVVTNTNVQVTKAYGVTWDVKDITSVELIDKLPTIEKRTNGFGTSDRSQGHFK